MVTILDKKIIVTVVRCPGVFKLVKNKKIFLLKQFKGKKNYAG